MNSKLQAFQRKLQKRISESRPGVISRVDLEPKTPATAEDIVELLSILNDLFASLEQQ